MCINAWLFIRKPLYWLGLHTLMYDLIFTNRIFSGPLSKNSPRMRNWRFWVQPEVFWGMISIQPLTSRNIKVFKWISQAVQGVSRCLLSKYSIPMQMEYGIKDNRKKRTVLDRLCHVATSLGGLISLDWLDLPINTVMFSVSFGLSDEGLYVGQGVPKVILDLGLHKCFTTASKPQWL